MKTQESTQYLTVSDVGRLVDLTPAGVRVAVARGQLRVARTTARGWRLFSRADVDAFIAARAKRVERAA